VDLAVKKKGWGGRHGGERKGVEPFSVREGSWAGKEAKLHLLKILGGRGLDPADNSRCGGGEDLE